MPTIAGAQWTSTPQAQLTGTLLRLLSQNPANGQERWVSEGVLRDWIIDEFRNSTVASVQEVANIGALPANGESNVLYVVADDGSGNTVLRAWNGSSYDAVGGSGTGGYTHPDHTGDVTSNGDGATTITDGAVTRAKIGNSAVGEDQLGVGAVTTTKIENDAVTLDKIAGSTANNLMGYDASGNPTEISIGANLTLNAGTLAGSGSGGGGALQQNYDAGNGVTVTATANGSNITTALANGVLTITVPSGEILLNATIDVTAASATYNTDAAGASFKVVIDNSANNSGVPQARNALVWKRTTNGTVNGGNPLTYDINMNSDMRSQDFANGIFSFVVQALGTRASTGAVIAL